MKPATKSRIRVIFAAAALALGVSVAANANEPQKKTEAAETAPAAAQAPDPSTLMCMDEQREEPRVVRLDDEVNDATVNALIQKLQYLDRKSHAPIEMRIDSPGGDVMAGLRLYDVMRGLGSPINTVCEGMCASMASVILEAGDTRSAMPHSIVMIHELSGGVGNGKYSDLKGRQKLLDILENSLVDIIARRSGHSPKEEADIMRTDTFYTAQEALKLGLVDKVLEPAPKDFSKARTAAAQPEAAPVRLALVPARKLAR